MSQYDLNVDVDISRETASITTSVFDVPLVVATFTNFLERTRTYASTTEVLADFSEASNVYKMAAKLFSGEVKLNQIVVGKRQTGAATITVQSAVVGQVYSFTISGITYAYTAIVDDTTADIGEALKAAYDLNPRTGITLTDNLNGTLSLAATSETLWSSSSTANVVVSLGNPTETWVEAIVAAKEDNPTPYVVLAETHDSDDVDGISAYIETTEMIYHTSMSDVEITTSGADAITTGLANATRTTLTWSQNADTEFPEAKWVGEVIPWTVGRKGWCFAKADGLTKSSLTTTTRNNLFNKDVNAILEIGGRLHFQRGVTLEGNGIFEIVVKDWIKARLQEEVFGLLIRLPKTPLSQDGISLVESAIRRVLDQAAANGAIDSSYTVTSPQIRDIGLNDKVEGIMKTFTFRAILIGETRKVEITGVLTY